MNKIDIVYLWVDGADKNWLREKTKWERLANPQMAPAPGTASAERYRDNNELLYSLRSVAQNAQFVNHIYIITGFNQIPKWLNTKNPKITIIPHEAIIPASALPTFNSNSIEMCIPNIPGLSEHFLLMNDDIFFNKKLSASFFFDRHGHAKNLYVHRRVKYKNLDQILKKSNTYRSTILLSAKKIHEIYGTKMYSYAPSHGIDPYLKSTWIQFQNHPEIKKHIEKQIHNKFRQRWEFQRWLFTLNQVVQKHATFRRSHPPKSGHNKILDTIYNITHWFSIRRSSYVCPHVSGHKTSLKYAAIFCINDSGQNTPQQLSENTEYLSKRFPNKSEFEK